MPHAGNYINKGTQTLTSVKTSVVVVVVVVVAAATCYAAFVLCLAHIHVIIICRHSSCVLVFSVYMFIGEGLYSTWTVHIV